MPNQRELPDASALAQKALAHSVNETNEEQQHQLDEQQAMFQSDEDAIAKVVETIAQGGDDAVKTTP